MINEIKKLYKNVGLDNLWVERYTDSNGFEHENWYPSYKVMIKSMMEKNGWTLTEARNVAKKECHKELLPFTAEKQIEIIKFLISKHARFDMFKNYEQKYLYMVHYECRYFPKQYLPFGEALAESINYLWQSLTEEEKQQVKGILE